MTAQIRAALPPDADAPGPPDAPTTHHHVDKNHPCSTRCSSAMYQDAPKEKALSLFRLRAYLLVRLAGIEPTTPWFVAKYSIQLSYSRNRVVF